MKKFLRLFVVSLAFMVMCILPMACDNNKTPNSGEITHTVTFVLGDNYDDVEVEVVDGKSIAETIEAFIPEISRGMNFLGWFLDDEYQDKFGDVDWDYDDESGEDVFFWTGAFDEPVTEDITLYACIDYPGEVCM